jgi:hypothetical protein
MHMHPHQQRAVEEAVHLDARIERLQHFLLSDGAEELDPHEHDLMSAQLVAMSNYSRNLHARIQFWRRQAGFADFA